MDRKTFAITIAIISVLAVLLLTYYERQALAPATLSTTPFPTREPVMPSEAAMLNLASENTSSADNVTTITPPPTPIRPSIRPSAARQPTAAVNTSPASPTPAGMPAMTPWAPMNAWTPMEKMAPWSYTA